MISNNNKQTHFSPLKSHTKQNTIIRRVFSIYSSLDEFINIFKDRDKAHSVYENHESPPNGFIS